MSRKRIVYLLGALALAGLAFVAIGRRGPVTPADAQSLAPAPPAGLITAAFAGGCFWCMVHPFDALPGVTEVVSGYTGGTVENPGYEEVSAGGTGHREAVLVTYDPAKIGYDKLLYVFWRNIDPLDTRGQFCDHGTQYTTAIFVAGEEQRRQAEASKAEMQKRFDGKVVTEILPAGPFWRAEAYHQDYYKKNPLHYKFYRFGCGRDARLDSVWGGEARAGIAAEAH